MIFDSWIWPASAAVFSAVLWFGLVRRQLEGEPPERDGRGLIGVYFMAQVCVWFASLLAVGTDPALEFEQRVGALGTGNAVGVFVALLLVRGHPQGRAAIGMQAQPHGSALTAGLAAYFAVVPLVIGLRLLSNALLPLVVDDIDTQTAQQLLQQFLEAEGARTPMIWLSMCLVIPFAEELLFRGALYGGLRARVGPWPAAFLSALIFAILHESATVLLPLFGLGVVLAWIYERTGSIAAPTLVHVLNNTFTLVIASTLPPESTP